MLKYKELKKKVLKEKSKKSIKKLLRLLSKSVPNNKKVN